MDPYKILGVQESKIKHPSDIQLVRQKARKLFKRFKEEKNKFDAEKVLDAFKLIEQKLKGGLGGDGPNKILGRSRMERMMDKHYNHQTKEIKGNKQVKKALKRAQKGDTDILRLPGDKERVPTGRGRMLQKRRRKHRAARRQKPKKKEVTILQGLARLQGEVFKAGKSLKALQLLRKFLKEYMNQDLRQNVFEVVQDVITEINFLEDPELRYEVDRLFEYMLSYFGTWFDEGDDERALGSYWRTATLVACRCYTDDAFILVDTINKLKEALALLEVRKDDLKEACRYEDDYGVPEPTSNGPKRARTREPEPSPPDSPFAAFAKAPDSPFAAFAKEEDASSDEGVKSEKDEEEDGCGKDGVKDVKEEADAKFEEVKVEAHVKEEAPVGPSLPEGPEMRPEIGPAAPPPSHIELLDDSEDEAVKKEAIDLDSDEDVKDEVKDEEISLSDGSVEESDVEVSSGDEEGAEDISSEEEEVIFATPPALQSLYRLRSQFVGNCLAALFKNRGPQWARPKIDAFFQDLYYRRSVFSLEQRTQIEGWQSRIKTTQRFGERDVGETNNPLEAHRPVVDAREIRNVIDADTNAWASKQTFDSRDRCGGRNVIR
eukprot:TRINITY_DN64612_c0_g1_i1.p1 TRINITY_DN64612_c0_g1~~TRINITY_DN64612_c0_g1_i1.p1  ORF type:complete len:603 (+),score=144.80 TRINITY_DN64612_c0_g1_i1:144-1952(+)